RFVGTVEPVTGRIVFRPERPGVHALATAYGAADDVSLTGTAAYDQATASLSGSITVATTNVMDLYDVRVTVNQISSSAVSAVNADGITSLGGGSAFYWSYGRFNRTATKTRDWRFSVPVGSSFTFRAQVWANVWKYSSGDGGTLQSISFV